MFYVWGAQEVQTPGGEGQSRRLETKHPTTLLGPCDNGLIKILRSVLIINTVCSDHVGAGGGGGQGAGGGRRDSMGRDEATRQTVKRDEVSVHSCSGLQTEGNICINLSTTGRALRGGMQGARAGENAQKIGGFF